MDEREEIKELIQRYNKLKEDKGREGLKEISEANVRSDFIDDLFAILGWDTKNPDEYDRENYVRGVGHADVALKVDGKPVVFVEAKRFGSIPEVDRDTTDWIEEERQVMNYAASPERKIKWAILTNFEKLRVFNALNGLLILDIKAPWEYEERLEELLYISRDAVKDGLLERLETRREKPDIDEKFLESLNKWRLMLANEIYEKNRDNHILKDGDGISLDKLKSAVQRILDRLIVVRYAEDKLILDNPDQLKSIYESWKRTSTYTSLYDIIENFFIGFDKIHNSKLFQVGHICEEVEIGGDVLGKIVEELYDINFRKFDFDILGNTYETYLGHTLYFKEDGTLGLKPSQETRKESGIYYTPPYVVDYIVKNTVGELLKKKKPEEVSKIKVLDPACGSGSFLIKAFDYFKDYYEKENEKRRKEIEEKIKEYVGKGGNSIHIFDNSGYEGIKEYEKKILKENLHGVDLDRQAAEIASVNLMLKALKKGEKLPLILGENIKVGNSLISGSEDELKKYFGDEWKEKHPFNWGDEFPEVFAQGGFDVVIGNPPYGADLSENEREYISNNYRTSTSYKNSALIFIEKSLNLLKKGERFGMILPKSLAFSQKWKPGRELIKNYIDKAVDVSKAFEDVLLEQIIVILKKIDGKQKYKIESIGSPERMYVDKEYIDKTDSIILHSNSLDFRVFEKMNDNCIYFSDISKTSRGLPFQKYLLETDSKYNVYRGKNISRYYLGGSNEYLDENEIDENNKKIKFLKQPKIISQRIVAHVTKPECHIIIMSTIDRDGVLTLDTIENTVITDDKYSLEFALCLLNSKLISWYAYRYIFAKAIRTMDLDDYYIGKIPIPKKEINQQPFITLVDKMLSLNKKLNSINVDFGHYVDLHPRVQDITLGKYLENLGLGENDKEVLNNANRIEGKVREFEIAEEGNWLVFTVGYERETREGKISKARIRAFKCRIKDRKMHKFLYYSMREFVTPGKVGKGNIYERILKIKVPCFHLNWEKNVTTINEVMEKYLANVEKWEKLDKEIKETDKKIDEKVYELYGLTEEEIKIVEEN
ncbi:MAG: N-6 DNA methylase [Candidatus Thermoplasmatota archaeon]|nr:N-6 DNA methylase [Candidatus Thermoplasmatota archaeon]